MFHASYAVKREQLMWDLDEVSVRMGDLFSVFEALINREENWVGSREETIDELREQQSTITSMGQVFKSNNV